MRKLLFLFTLFMTAGTALLHAANIDFKAIAPEAVVMGENFRIAYTVNTDGVNEKDLRIPDMPDFDMLMGPSSSVAHSSSWINGKSSSETTTTFTYTLRAKKEGTFNIPPASIKVKNSTYTSKALTIRVLPKDKQDEAAEQNNRSNSSSSGVSDKDMFMRMIISKKNVYEQEPILVTFKIYTAISPTGISNAKFPEFDGFLVRDIEIPMDNLPASLENYNGRNYQTYVIKQALLFPQRSGKITIDGGKCDIGFRVAVQQQRPQSIFDSFRDMFRDASKTLATTPVTIDVKPLPSGKPASFSGAVGDFKMDTHINKTNLSANEAVTITTTISGTGNIRLVKEPEVKFPNDFDTYDPIITLNSRTTTAGETGTKTIEYTSIPRFGGEFDIPPITFSYFEPKSGTYKTLSSEPYKLQVEKGEEGDASGPVVSNFGNNRESVRLLGQDIRYLKTKSIHFIPQGEIFFGSITYYLCYLIPALLFIVFFFIYRKQVKENANIALVRTKKANKMATKRLKNAGKLLKEGKKEEFYDEVLRALWGYLSDKLNIPQSSLTKDNVEIELQKYGVGEDLIREFMDILNTCEFAKYAPSQASDAMDKLYELTVDAIGKMENTIKK